MESEKSSTETRSKRSSEISEDNLATAASETEIAFVESSDKSKA